MSFCPLETGSDVNTRSHVQRTRSTFSISFHHEALHMRAKLQGAGYEQEVVKWDSDSDSDGSDDESDLMV